MTPIYLSSSNQKLKIFTGAGVSKWKEQYSVLANCAKVVSRYNTAGPTVTYHAVEILVRPKSIILFRKEGSNSIYIVSSNAKYTEPLCSKTNHMTIPGCRTPNNHQNRHEATSFYLTPSQDSILERSPCIYNTYHACITKRRCLFRLLQLHPPNIFYYCAQLAKPKYRPEEKR